MLRKVGVSQLRSSRLKNFQDGLTGIQVFRVHNADFCIIVKNHLPHNHSLFSNGYLSITSKRDFQTLGEGMDIATLILNCWARCLNSKINKLGSMSRLCLDVVTYSEGSEIAEDVLFKCWDNFLENCNSLIDADLIMLPAHMNDHLFLIAFNLKRNKILYLDNLNHPCKSSEKE